MILLLPVISLLTYLIWSRLSSELTWKILVLCINISYVLKSLFSCGLFLNKTMPMASFPKSLCSVVNPLALLLLKSIICTLLMELWLTLPIIKIFWVLYNISHLLGHVYLMLIWCVNLCINMAFFTVKLSSVFFLQYFHGTLNFGLCLLSRSLLSLCSFLDADWVSCPNIYSVFYYWPYCVYLGANCISWASQKQTTVSRFNVDRGWISCINGLHYY